MVHSFAAGRPMLWLATAAGGLILSALIAVPAQAQSNQDRVRLVDGTELRGTITAMTKESVTIDSRDGEPIPATQIRSIRYAGEPALFDSRRNAALDGRFENALEDLAEFDPADFEGTRAVNLQHDLQYLKAYSTANLALAGSPDHTLDDAEKSLDAYIKAAPNDYHMMKAYELLGDIRAANEDYAGAEKAYDELTRSTVDGFRLQGLVAKGNTLLRQDKVSEAEAAFNQVASQVAETPDIQRFVYFGQLGKAAAMGRQGQGQQAIGLARGVIEKAPEDPQLYARAYTTLGNIYRQQNAKKEALLNYLHVDVLYRNQAPQDHAEALYYLTGLWQDMGNGDRSQQAAAALKDLYGNSSWAKRLN